MNSLIILLHRPLIITYTYSFVLVSTCITQISRIRFVIELHDHKSRKLKCPSSQILTDSISFSLVFPVHAKRQMCVLDLNIYMVFV